jgi:hypothetical protein
VLKSVINDEVFKDNYTAPSLSDQKKIGHVPKKDSFVAYGVDMYIFYLFQVCIPLNLI